MQHDYGLKDYDELADRTYCRYRPFKKVVLTNVGLAKNRITVDKVEKHLKGLGLPEWERKQAVWLVNAIVEALKNGQKIADITKMFSCDFIVEDDFGGEEILLQRNIQNELMYKLFWKVSEDKDELRVKLDWRVVFL